jgi:hypothetical protein
LGLREKLVYSKKLVGSPLIQGKVNIILIEPEFGPNNKPVIPGYTYVVNINIIVIGIITLHIQHQKTKKLTNFLPKCPKSSLGNNPINIPFSNYIRNDLNTQMIVMFLIYKISMMKTVNEYDVKKNQWKSEQTFPRYNDSIRFGCYDGSNVSPDVSIPDIRILLFSNSDKNSCISIRIFYFRDLGQHK